MLPPPGPPGPPRKVPGPPACGPPRPPADGRAQQIRQPEARQHRVGLQHLDVEADPDQGGPDQQGAQAAALGGDGAGPGCQQQRQHQHRVQGVVAVGDHGDGGDRQRRRGHERSQRSERASDQQVQDAHGGDAGQRLRQQQRDATEPEHPRAQHLEPQAQRRLVDRDEPARVEGGEHERVPVLEHAPHGGGVVGVAEPLLVQPDQVEGSAEREHGRGRRQIQPGSSMATRPVIRGMGR
jgi:hypothetical protein